MQKITGFGNESKQILDQELPNGEIYSLELEYQTQGDITTSGWFLSLKYNDLYIFTYQKLCLKADYLYEYKNFLPYGIFIYSENKLEPNFLNCFSLDLVKMYIIDSTERDSIIALL